MDIEKIWNEAVSFKVYLERAQDAVDHPVTPIEKEYHEYYTLGVQRMNRMYKTYKPDERQLKDFAEKNFRGKILIISEPWCGDASQVLPVVCSFFSATEIRITYRDQKPSLIDDFLTNGSRSIPIVIFLNENYQVISSWGPRPDYGHKLFLKHKANPSVYSDEELHNDLQVYYAKNKGIDTIEELLSIL